ncbi:MAG: DUF4249 family protein [Algoriphagus sp.]|uniref:DUF4249 family protein n=1 Tax=Algoriphagus sp. TaxID=1872435 RepID=UPI002608113D|nr:DUF4249 family protein [Algoriphagus sp.]MDG1278735.1 DUF4249 family protein [Algoriphagus sp.]
MSKQKTVPIAIGSSWQWAVHSWQLAEGSGSSWQFADSSLQVVAKVCIRKRLSNLLLLVVVLLGSCVEKIDFPLNRGVEKLIVSGQINNLDEPQYVYLSETTSADREPLLSGNYFVLNDLPRPVSGALISLKSDQRESWTYRMIEPGKYELSNFGGLESGVAYHIEIAVEGRSCRSEPEVFTEVIGTDNLSYTFDRGVFQNQPETAFITIQTAVTLPEQVGDYYLRWDVDEAYYWDLTFFPNPFNRGPGDCYVFDFPDPERITLLNGDLLNRPGGISTQIVAGRIVDQSFLSRHYFNIRQTSTSKASYDYWRKVRELVNNTGSVFDTPPAPIKGNLRNVNVADEVVLGYFEVANVNVTRIYTTRADVPYFIEEVCTYSPTRRLDDYPATCLRCSEFKNSTTVTPPWWFD